MGWSVRVGWMLPCLWLATACGGHHPEPTLAAPADPEGPFGCASQAGLLVELRWAEEGQPLRGLRVLEDASYCAIVDGDMEVSLRLNADDFLELRGLVSAARFEQRPGGAECTDEAERHVVLRTPDHELRWEVPCPQQLQDDPSNKLSIRLVTLRRTALQRIPKRLRKAVHRHGRGGRGW